ncbi:YafY family protein [Streptomyces sp. NBC_00091]|uniref:helix-turn-helix transcriptional regulator n=1 Tax=Streptomyces sp. NBC_00091 TaxID=2975648 RepID=UPI00225446FC|nr:YafY family protein [Streptomyces sp. NBC_00091]MCX5377836.1 YafY family transcriptional regulator [Streptomyces sp. NBC_00091]
MNDTPARLLTLLSLLQTPREWPGSELAERLRVSSRTIRRDIERLRELGYPVEATLGAEGGYRLVAGAAMPPLLLDDEEAVAIAVGLRAGAGHAIEGVEEASVRALAKLEQVLPARLRHRVGALQSATVAVTRGDGPSVDPRTLTTMAGAVAGPERLRFAYRSRDGVDSRRLVEPYRLVSTGSRWYLVAYDLEREDWRTFRVDRVSEPFATGARFAPRQLPMEAAEFVRRGLRGAQTYPVDAFFAAPPQELPAWLGEAAVAEAGGARVRFESGDAPEWLAGRMALTGVPFTVRGPEFLAAAARELGARLAGAGGEPSGPA